MTDEEAEKIARKLTKAQREALLEAKPSGLGGIRIPPPNYYTALVLLREMLVSEEGTLTQLGLRVRAALQRMERQA